jgi:peptide/nickel transport system permease protein
MTSSKPNNPSPSYTRRVARRFRRSIRGVAGLCAVLVLLAVAVLSPLLAGRQPIVCRYEGKLYYPAVVDVVHKIPFASRVIKKSKPFNLPTFDAKTALNDDDFAIWPLIPYGPLETSEHDLQPPSSEHWLGTDEVGRDLASRLVHGAVVSINVGLVSMGIAAFIGIIIGGLAGYYGRWVDALLSRLIEVVTCFPVLFLILSVMVWLEPSIVNVMVVIGLTRWTSIARYTRGEFIRLKERDYITAARAAGAGAPRIMFRHLLPNALAPILVTITFGIAHAVLIEAALSWLGFGVQPPQPSWGNLLHDAYVNLRSARYMVYPPCIAVFVSVLAYNLVGDALRDAVDPRIHNDR